MDTVSERGAGRKLFWELQVPALSRSTLRTLLRLSHALLDASSEAEVADVLGAYLSSELHAQEALLYFRARPAQPIAFDHEGLPPAAGVAPDLLADARAALAGGRRINGDWHAACVPRRQPDVALLVRWPSAEHGAPDPERELAASYAAELAVKALRHVQVRERVRAASDIDHARELARRDQQEDEIRRQSLTDQMTGLINRRGFFLQAEQAFRSAQRRHAACAVIFADVDNLKHINDQQGHEAGDRLICDAASVFRESFREADVVARLGGDEFVAFTLDDEQPEKVLRRIAARLHAFNLMQERPYQLSFSTGIVACDPDGSLSLADYLVLADQQMYQRKQGRLH